MQVVSLQGGQLKLAVKPGEGHVARFMTDARKAQLAVIVESILGRRIRIQVDLEAAPQSPDSQTPSPDSIRLSVSNEARKKAMELPLVKQVTEMFNATLIDVKSVDPPQPGPTADQTESEEENV